MGLHREVVSVSIPSCYGQEGIHGVHRDDVTAGRVQLLVGDLVVLHSISRGIRRGPGDCDVVSGYRGDQ